MPRIVMPRTSEEVAVPAAQSITVFTQDSADVSQMVNSVKTLLGTVTAAQQTFGPFASGARIIIDAFGLPSFYGTGMTPILSELIASKIQRAPIAINAAGAIPASALVNGLISSTSLLGITCTLPTGTQMEAVSNFRMDEAFDWCVMATGLFGFTVGASAGHTIIGAAAVGSGTSAGFRTRKTGTATFVTYRIN